MESAQPALLFLVPFTLIPVIGTAYLRGDLAAMWQGDFPLQVNCTVHTYHRRPIIRSNQCRCLTDIEKGDNEILCLNRCTWLPCFADNCFLCVLLGKDEEVDEDESVVKVPCPPPAVAVEEAAVEDVAAAETAAEASTSS